jgi:hypothetical protein
VGKEGRGWGGTTVVETEKKMMVKMGYAGGGAR